MTKQKTFNRTIEQIAWLVAAVMVFLGYIASVSPVWEYIGGDSVEYLNLAHSMLKGYGYTLFGEPYVLYPPLYPLVLLAVMKVFGVTAWYPMHILNALFGFGGLVVISRWLRRRGTAGIIASWLSLLSYYYWSFSVRFILSEPLFVLLVSITLVFAYRLLKAGDAGFWKTSLVGAGAMLCIMTRPAALGLVVALCTAGSIRWFQLRNRTSILLVLVVAVLAGGCFGYWNVVRPVVVDPNAPETHFSWALRFVGIKTDAGRMVERGDGVKADTEEVETRFMTFSSKFGQIATSIPRLPGNAQPMFVGCVLLFLVGVGCEIRKEIWSPVAWYAMVYSIMIYMTKWSVNYQRYLYVLIPLIFYFLFQGVVWLFRRSGGLTRKVKILGMILLGAWGFFCFWGDGMVQDDIAAGGVNTYVLIVCWLLVFFYLTLVVVGFWNRWVLNSIAIRNGIIILLICGCGFHTSMLVVQRYKRMRSYESLCIRNLDGPMVLSRKLSEVFEGDHRIVSSSPRLVSAMTGYIAKRPIYNVKGMLCLEDVDYVMLLGPLNDVAQERPVEEKQLAEAVCQGRSDYELQLVLKTNASYVYKVGDKQ